MCHKLRRLFSEEYNQILKSLSDWQKDECSSLWKIWAVETGPSCFSYMHATYHDQMESPWRRFRMTLLFYQLVKMLKSDRKVHSQALNEVNVYTKRWLIKPSETKSCKCYNLKNTIHSNTVKLQWYGSQMLQNI